VVLAAAMDAVAGGLSLLSLFYCYSSAAKMISHQAAKKISDHAKHHCLAVVFCMK
jgi:hypothetical protein